MQPGVAGVRGRGEDGEVVGSFGRETVDEGGGEFGRGEGPAGAAGAVEEAGVVEVGVGVDGDEDGVGGEFALEDLAGGDGGGVEPVVTAFGGPEGVGGDEGESGGDEDAITGWGGGDAACDGVEAGGGEEGSDGEEGDLIIVMDEVEIEEDEQVDE